MTHANPRRPKTCEYAQDRGRENGVALLAMLTLVALWCLTLFVGQLSAKQLQANGVQNTAAALAQAKQELMARAVANEYVTSAGYLSMPDLGKNFMTGLASEGIAAVSFTGNLRDLSVVGKLPWWTLHSGPLRDEHGECLWYAVSGTFKNATQTAAFNWDTPGQFDVIDGGGNAVARNLAAIVIAPGAPLDGQDRRLADDAYVQCGGNYVAKNYLDAFASGNAVAGTVNYFSGMTTADVPEENITATTANKRFVLVANEHYNDQFVFLSGDEIFSRLTKRVDFAAAIKSLLDDPMLREQMETGHPGVNGTIAVSSGPGREKGTANLNCTKLSTPDNQRFCKNWKEMLFLTALGASPTVEIDGVVWTSCKRVLIFSGSRTATQNRSTGAEKADKNNYLEAPNLDAFGVPSALGSNFSGFRYFNWQNPSADLIRCLP